MGSSDAGFLSQTSCFIGIFQASCHLRGSSDMNVDDASLPSDDGDLWDEPSAYQHRLPYGTLRVQEEDTFLSTSGMLSRIQESQGRYHRLDFGHAELGDTKTEIVLLALGEGSAPTRDHGLGPTADREIPKDHLDWIRLLPALDRTMTSYHPRLYGTFRIIDLSANNLSFDCLPVICRFLNGNLTLRSLSLKANEIGEDVEGFALLARALGKSALRSLSLSSNPIMPASMAAFFDSIPKEGTSLECLELSNVFSDDLSGAMATEDEALIAAQAVASFIADPTRCRSLYALRLNGNTFGNRGVRAIVHALIGSAPSLSESSKRSLPDGLSDLQTDPFYSSVLRARQRAPKKSLEVLELLGNVDRAFEQEELDRDLEKFRSIRKRYTCIRLEDIETIVAFFDERARRKRLRQRDTLPIPVEVSRYLPKLDATLDQWESDFQETAQLGAGLSSVNWNSIYFDQLTANRLEGERCRRAALSILGATRTVGCKASRGPPVTREGEFTGGDSANGFPKFLDLPPEIRVMVLRKLDDHGSLSASQFNNVISFACEPLTIGYGDPSYNWERVYTGSLPSYISNYASTLPARKWSWVECFAQRAPLRDWTADLLDAADDKQLSRPRRVHWNWSEDRARPSMYAFLESTLTHRAEN